ncbi:MAG: D-tyrosyl-tRNA(Tyr) deacylase [Clostridia bacterium]|nr:D-tyrosyl-tRNA(Tyr) deacylase [Clostridia bacterium]
MKAVIQRVSQCRVTVDGNVTGEISDGFLILLGVEQNDTEKDAEKLSAKIAVLRIFTDENDKMNLSLKDIDGEVLVVSNFTLCANCRKGRRPNFENAARPETADPLYEYFCQCMLSNGIRKVEKGIFGADMKVSLLNDGPVTIIINSKDLA